MEIRVIVTCGMRWSLQRSMSKDSRCWLCPIPSFKWQLYQSAYGLKNSSTSTLVIFIFFCMYILISVYRTLQ